MNKLEKQKVEEQFPDVKRNQFLDNICDLHKDNDWGGKKKKGKLLDWRNNEDDKESLIWYLDKMRKYAESPCSKCGDPIHVCNDNPDTNHYELVMDNTGEIIGESERMFKGKKLGGVETEAEGRDTKLKLKKEEKKYMFNLSEFKPDDYDKHYTIHQCLSQNAMVFLELASDKAFELLDEYFDDNEEELEELKFFFAEAKTSLLASRDDQRSLVELS